MKKQAIIAGAVAILGLATQANAQTPVYVTGSTAFRSQTVAAIQGMFDGGAPTNTVCRGNTNPQKAQWGIFEGFIGGQPYNVYTLWSGSEAGLAALSGTTVPDTDFNQNPDTLPYDQCYFLLPTASGELTANPTATETNTTVQIPDLSMADTSKAVSFSKSASFTTFGSGSFVTVVPFTWAKCTNSSGASFPAWIHLTNITHFQADVELGAPQVSSFFTGVATDTNFVFQVGRNKGSGTRVNALADTGYGITKAVDQWAVDPQGTTAGELSPPFVSAGAVDAAIPGYQVVEVVNAGFDSGSFVAADLLIDGCVNAADPINNIANGGPVNYTGVVTIGYVGISDALTVGTNLWLTLNGVLESDDAVAQGQYSYWGMEHLYGKPGLSGSQLTYGGNLFTAIQAQALALANGAGKHSAAVALTYMQCTKGSDTAFPTHN